MHRLSWNSITSETRIPQKTSANAGKYRSEIESDYHRIIRSASFRRLQDKTQVFPLDNSDFVRTRLTHSLEVSSIAKLIGKQVCIQVLDQQLAPAGDQPDSLKVIEILNCAGLLHDIGNPPFGHFGESAIRNWFEKNLSLLQFKQRPLQAWLDEHQQADLLYYEGNAQALRIITKLHRLTGRSGMHLTSSVMDTIIKYPVNSLEKLAEDTKEKSKRSLLRKKVGYYQSETDQFLEIKQNTGTTGCRNPLCFILEAADDLAYTFADLEDGYKKGLYSYEQLLDVIVEAQLIRSLKQFAFDRVYNDAAILKLELMGNEIITFLLDRFMDALLPYDSGLNMSEIQEKYIDLLSGNYLNTYQYTAQDKEDGERLYLRLLLGADFVSGMTDSYAIRLYQELKGI